MSNKYNLSEGAVQVIMNGGHYSTPIMQVLSSKMINSATPDKKRYRYLLSDGKHTIPFGLLSSEIEDSMGKTGIEAFSVIRINRYITSVNNYSGKGESRSLVILDMQVLVPGSEEKEKIGSPTVLTDTYTSCSSTDNTCSTPKKFKPSTSNGAAAVDMGDQSFRCDVPHPISSLSPYFNKWVIKARVTNKSSIRTWTNSRGDGKFFSLTLTDESGEIKLVAFNKEVDKFYDYIQLDKIYYISKCLLKPATTQFNSVKHDYEMTLIADSSIQESQDGDDFSIPRTQFNFTSIDKIASAEVNSLIDVMGVVKNASDLQTFQSKSTGKDLKKKELVLVDQTRTSINLTLWGTDAENFDSSNNPVVIIKGARITEFAGGKSLCPVSTSVLRINPNMAECNLIRAWYDKEGRNVDATNISARSGAGTFNTTWMSFKEAQEQDLGRGEKADYYQVMGTVLLMRSDNAIYKACPMEECNKKVIDLENGSYRCEKCNREFPNFKYRLLASLNVSDWSTNQWMTMFNSEVENILGMTSEEVGHLVEQDADAMIAIADKVNFKQFVMKCRAKVENYNDESRLKTVCVKAEPINYEEYNAHLIERIQQYIG